VGFALFVEDNAHGAICAVKLSIDSAVFTESGAHAVSCSASDKQRNKGSRNRMIFTAHVFVSQVSRRKKAPSRAFSDAVRLVQNFA
jgi:hypothetical protein